MSIDGLLDKINSLLIRHKYDKALTLLYKFCIDIRDLPIQNKFITSKELDGVCQEIGDLYLKSKQISAPLFMPNNNICIYLTSVLYNQGGHTRELIAYIKSMPQLQHRVLVTNLPHDQTDEKQVLALFDEIDNVEVLFCTKKHFIDKMQWLMRQLLTIQPKNIFLFSHPMDPVITGVIKPYMADNIYFFCHVDFNFSLGYHLDEAITYIAFRPYQYAYLKHVLHINNLIFIPLSVHAPLSLTDHHLSVNDVAFKVKEVLTASSFASDKKIAALYDYDFCEIVPYMMSLTKGKHLHIGGLSRAKKKAFIGNMQKYAVPIENFKHMTYVTSVQETLKQYQVDLFINSFPVGGGMTAIESLLADIPVLFHANYTDPNLNNNDLFDNQGIVWGNREELENIYCKDLPARLALNKIEIQRVKDNYYDLIVKQKLMQDITTKLKGIPIPDNNNLGILVQHNVNLTRASLNSIQAYKHYSKQVIFFKIKNILRQLLPMHIQRKIKGFI